MAKPAGAHDDLTDDLIKVCDALEERYGRRKHQPYEDVIEALCSQILELGVPEKHSRDATKRLRDEFIDWNDMRVATIREIEDVLGARYPKVREKAEDIRHLLADLYTAFRRMDIREALMGDGIETLRALPETSNIRRDFVDRALLLALQIKVFPTDEEQLRLLKFLGGAPKTWTLQQAQKRIEEALDIEGLDRLSRVLREHVQMYQEAGLDEPQIIAHGWDKADPLGMDKTGKPRTSRIEKTEKTEKAEKPATARTEKPKAVEKPAAKKADKSAPAKAAEKPKAVEKPKSAEKAKNAPAKAPAKPVKTEKKPDQKPDKKADKKPEPKADKKAGGDKKPAKK